MTGVVLSMILFILTKRSGVSLLWAAVALASASCSSESGGEVPYLPIDLMTWDRAKGDVAGDLQLDLRQETGHQGDSDDFETWVAPDSGTVPQYPKCLDDVNLASPAALFSKSCSEDERCVCSEADLGQVVSWFLDSAKGQVEVAVMELQDFTVSKKLAAIRGQGVGVRVVLDDGYDTPEESNAVADLEGGGVDFVSDMRPGGFMHCKYVILDGKGVLVSSANFSIYDGRSNANNIVYLPSADLAAVFRQHFDGMFEEKLFGKPKNKSKQVVTINGYEVEVYFGPSWAVMDRIESAIQNAKHSLDFSIYSFTAHEIRDALDDRCGSIPIRGVYDEAQDAGDDNSVAKWGWCSGADVRPAAVTGSTGFRKLHHKVLVVDAGQPGGFVVTGSANWSYSAVEKNDEVTVVLHDPALVAAFASEFEARHSEAGGGE